MGPVPFCLSASLFSVADSASVISNRHVVHRRSFQLVGADKPGPWIELNQPPRELKMNRQDGTTPEDRHSDSLNRRSFVKAGSAALVATSVASTALADKKKKKPKKTAAAEASVGELYASLSDKQKETICFKFGHPLQSRINPNWHITKPEIDDDFYTKAQRELATRIIKGVCSEDGYKRFLQQMEDDDGGVGAYSMAIFGQPGEGDFQWVLTGRHLTLRADGNSTKQVAFGGGIVYGHSEEEPEHNLFHYHTKKANEVFEALDEKHRLQALLKKAPKESQVPIQGAAGRFPGVPVSDLSSDQEDLVEQTIKVGLAPYRESDVKEVMQLLKKGGGLDKLSMAFYQQGDINNDKVWDIWRVEGPSFVWHFRGAPHVHTYINIGLKKG